MWIGDVDIPERLVAALRENRLVLFVGAGASVDAPSSLPTFAQLAKLIAGESAVRMTEDDGKHPDGFLGDLDLGGPIGQVDVHQRVAELIGAPASQPNDLHRAISALASAGKKVRIVTTNYDRHLSTCLPEEPEFRCPALPMGDDFEGVVYLHGTLVQDPRFLVVTDRDFGRAYLTDAWAARFLERMFRTYVVLFVGYSHDDVVMSYLARGLPRETDRYALTFQPESQKWRSLGVTPVSYALMEPSDSHEAAHRTLARWAEVSRLGLLDHRRRVADLVATPPSLTPEEQSYLEETVADETRVRFFVDHAAGSEWLHWIEGRQTFRDLFDPRVEAGAVTRDLAFWFARQATDVTQSEAALSVLAAQGGQIGEGLWMAIAQELHASAGPRPPYLDRWIALLVEFAPRRAHEFIDYALNACQWPADRQRALLLFDHLTLPRLGLDRLSSFDGSARLTVELPGKDYWLTETWNAFFAPNLAELAHDLMPIVDHHLRLAYRLQALSSRSGFDGLSYARSAIERRDTSETAVGCLIDFARDSLMTQLAVDPELGRGYLHAWSRSDLLLLRRLAVHGWVTRPDVGSDEKLAWLAAQDWLYHRGLRHEVFELMSNALRVLLSARHLTS